MGSFELGLVAQIAAQDEKHEWPELVVLIVLPLVLSFMLLRIARRRRGAAWQKWASLVPLVAGALLALDPFGDIRSFVYRNLYHVSDRSTYLHYATLLVPCAAILGTVAYLLYLGHRERMEQ
ncbi:MAG: hypothetical protein IH945_03965 [Armatimonadetes bacterium]|nr:hypothetical protein [Armatimonadota bacterium]